MNVIQRKVSLLRAKDTICCTCTRGDKKEHCFLWEDGGINRILRDPYLLSHKYEDIIHKGFCNEKEEINRNPQKNTSSKKTRKGDTKRQRLQPKAR